MHNAALVRPELYRNMPELHQSMPKPYHSRLKPCLNLEMQWQKTACFAEKMNYKSPPPPYSKKENDSMNPAKFIREVRSEGSKVTWPTRKETMVSTIMVLVLTAIAATFFVVVDFIVNIAIRFILGL